MNFVVFKPLKLFLLGLAALFALGACSSSTNPASSGWASDEIAYVASVAIDSFTSQAELEATYGGQTVLFKPEAGFAVLGFDKASGELTTLSTEENLDSFSAPEVNISGHSTWASGHSAWAGGHSAWASGFSAWAGGWSAWAGGDTVPELPSGNNRVWEQINLYEAHQVATNFGEGIKVAVIDTGLDLNHMMFQNNLAPQSEWKDFVDGDSYPMEEGSDSDRGYGHGTAVAGIILQVAPKATILPIRVLNANGGGDLDDVIQAIDWAAQQGAKVINLSLGSIAHSSILETVVANAIQSHDLLVTASLGNGGWGAHAMYPASGAHISLVYKRLYDVASVDSANAFSSFNSSYFTNVDQLPSNRDYYLAPGENIVTAYPGDRLTQATGTSFATPIYSGALALAMSERQATMSSVDYDHWYEKSAIEQAAKTGLVNNSNAFWSVNVAGLVQAAGNHKGYNMISNSGFEHANYYALDGLVWKKKKGTTTSSGHYAGQEGGLIDGTGSLYQDINGLYPNTTYRYGAWAKVDSAKEPAYLIVEDENGAVHKTAITSSNYTWIEFEFTTGANSTSVRVSFEKPSGRKSAAFADDFVLMRK